MNIRPDILTPKERVMALLTGKPLDRLICMPIMTSNTVLLTGKTIKEFQLDGGIMAEAHIEAFKRFRYDLIYLFTNCSYIAEAMGQELVYSDDEPANCEKPIIQSEADLDKIKVAEKNGGQFPVYYDALDILNREIGSEVFGSLLLGSSIDSSHTKRD